MSAPPHCRQSSALPVRPICSAHRRRQTVTSRRPQALRDREGPFSLYWRDLPDLAPWLSSFVLSSRGKRFDQLTQSLAALMRHIEAGHGPLLEEAGLGSLSRGAGSMHLYRSAEELTAGIAAMARRNAAGIRGEILGPEEIRRLEPELAPSYIGGAIFHDAFVIDSPEAYCRGLAKAILSRGAAHIPVERHGYQGAGGGQA